MLYCLIFHRRRMEILREKSSSFILVIDACSSQPCLNGGICNATANGFTCLCSPLLTGVRCEIGIGKFCDESNSKGHFLLIVRSSLWFHCFCATRLNDLCIILAPSSARCWPISIRLSFRSSDFTTLQILDPWEWLASDGFLQFHPWLKYHGQWNKENDHQFQMLLIIKQILLVSSLENYREQYGEKAKGRQRVSVVCEPRPYQELMQWTFICPCIIPAVLVTKV